MYDYYNNNYKHPITVEDFKEYVKNNHHLKSVWIQKSFAHKIKQITCILLGCTMEQLEDPIFKETPLGEEWWKWEIKLDGGYGTLSLPYLNTPNKVLKQYENLKLVKLTPRLLLQLLGTESGRDIIHTNIWVNATMADYKLTPDPNITIKEWQGKKSFSQKEAFEYMYPSGHRYPNWVISDVRFFNETKAIKDKGGILIRVNRDSDSKDSHVSENELNTYKDWDYVIDNNYSLSELILKVKQIMFKEGIIYE